MQEPITIVRGRPDPANQLCLLCPHSFGTNLLRVYTSATDDGYRFATVVLNLALDREQIPFMSLLMLEKNGLLLRGDIPDIIAVPLTQANAYTNRYKLSREEIQTAFDVLWRITEQSLDQLRQLPRDKALRAITSTTTNRYSLAPIVYEHTNLNHKLAKGEVKSVQDKADSFKLSPRRTAIAYETRGDQPPAEPRVIELIYTVALSLFEKHQYCTDRMIYNALPTKSDLHAAPPEFIRKCMAYLATAQITTTVYSVSKNGKRTTHEYYSYRLPHECAPRFNSKTNEIEDVYYPLRKSATFDLAKHLHQITTLPPQVWKTSLRTTSKNLALIHYLFDQTERATYPVKIYYKSLPDAGAGKLEKSRAKQRAQKVLTEWQERGFLTQLITGTECFTVQKNAEFDAVIDTANAVIDTDENPQTRIVKPKTNDF